MKDLNKNNVNLAETIGSRKHKTTAGNLYELVQRAKLILEEFESLEQKEALKNILNIVNLSQDYEFLIGDGEDELNFIHKVLTDYQAINPDLNNVDYDNANKWLTKVNHLLLDKWKRDPLNPSYVKYNSTYGNLANEEIKNHFFQILITNIAYGKYGVIMNDLASTDELEVRDGLDDLDKFLERKLDKYFNQKSFYFGIDVDLYKKEFTELRDHLSYISGICDLRFAYLYRTVDGGISISANMIKNLAKLKDIKTVTNAKELKKYKRADQRKKRLEHRHQYHVDDALEWLQAGVRHNPFIFYEIIHDLYLPSNKEDLRTFIQKAEKILKPKEIYALKSNFNLDRLTAPLNRKRLEWLGINGKSIEEILRPNNPYHDSPRSKNPMVHLNWDMEHGRVEKKLRVNFQNVEFDIEEFKSISIQEN